LAILPLVKIHEQLLRSVTNAGLGVGPKALGFIRGPKVHSGFKGPMVSRGARQIGNKGNKNTNKHFGLKQNRDRSNHRNV
jgi:hypothetical protein